MAGPLGPRQLEEVARQRRQAHAVVQTPQRPARSRFLHGRRIHGPHLERAPGDDRQALLLEQPDTQRVQPALGFLQPFQQRHVRQVRQMRLSGANHRLPQRVSAAEVQQKGPQQVVDRLVFAQPLQRPGILRQFAPVLGEERQQQPPSPRPPCRLPCPASAGQDTPAAPRKHVSAYGVTPVRLAHLLELREALAAAYGASGASGSGLHGRGAGFGYDSDGGGALDGTAQGRSGVELKSASSAGL